MQMVAIVHLIVSVSCNQVRLIPEYEFNVRAISSESANIAGDLSKDAWLGINGNV
jgi:hypothetical protein